MTIVIVSLVFMTVLLAAVAAGHLVVRVRSDLRGSQPPTRRRTLIQTGAVKQMVKAAEDIARRRGLLLRLERRLEQADIQLRAGEVLFVIAATVVLTGALASVLLPFPVLLAVPVASAGVPLAALLLAGQRRRRRFAAQLPDMLTLLAGTLRSGYSLHQGLEAVSHEVGEPIAGETRRVLTETRLGRHLEDALADCATRIGSDDLGWTVLALGIQREVGGNLAELLDTVAETMVQRERLRREISALTAEGRMSAMVLGVLPPGLGGVLFVLNPQYVGRLFEDLTGQVMVVVSGAVALAGFFWMKKIIDIEV